MRIFIASLFVLFLMHPVSAQVPSKSEMQAQMKEAANALKKEIAELEKQVIEAKKNKEEESVIKDLEEQVTMLKKQVAMMEGAGKSISGISEKTFQQAEEGSTVAPKKDVARINSLPKNILTDAELLSFVKKIHADVDKLIPAAEKTEALKIYSETKAKYNSVVENGNAATGCWIYGHWEKALWLAGKACLDSMADPDILNNYCAFLTMIGAEHAAIPILKYLNNKYPKNSTVLNNIGQAWLGLGDMTNAKINLESATALFPSHSTANLTLSTIYLYEADSARAIAAMRRSLRNCFTIEKAAELESLGAELDDDDIEFDYPMEDDDPLGFGPFFDVFPYVPGSIGETPKAQMEWEAFREATQMLDEKVAFDNESARIRTEEFANKMMDSDYNQPVLKLHSSHVHIKAGRKLPLAVKKKTAISIEQVMSMMADTFHQVTTARLNVAEKKRREGIDITKGCQANDAVNNTFMNEAKAIIDEGRAAMKFVYRQNKRMVHNYIKLTAYSSLNDYNERMGTFHEEIWKKNLWIYAYTAIFASAYKSLKERPAMYSSCEGEDEVPKQPLQLPLLKKPDCTHSASLNLPVGGIKEECNTCTIDESKLKYRQDFLHKGEIQVSDATNSSAQGPQTQESIDPSKSITIDCNKLGPVKVDRDRRTKSQRCTVNSNRSVDLRPTNYIGGRILAR